MPKFLTSSGKVVNTKTKNKFGMIFESNMDLKVKYGIIEDNVIKFQLSTEQEIFNGIGVVFNPFFVMNQFTFDTKSMDFFSSPNTGISFWSQFYKYFTKSYNVSKDRMHGRPHIHTDSQNSEHYSITSGRTKQYHNHTLKKWRGSNAYGHTIPPNIRQMTSHPSNECKYTVYKRHYEISDCHETHIVDGTFPGNVIEFEDINHNINSKTNRISDWERLFHPEWDDYYANWNFDIIFGRLPECLSIEDGTIIKGNIQDYDRFLMKYENEDWFDFYGHVVDENYKDFRIKPSNPRVHTVVFEGFYPRLNLNKKVDVKFVIHNNFTYDRDRFILNSTEPYYIDGKQVDNQTYLDRMKLDGYFIYEPQDGSEDVVFKSLEHEIIDEDEMRIDCEIVSPEVFYDDNYDQKSKINIYVSCCNKD